MENPYKNTHKKTQYVVVALDGNYRNLVPKNFKWMLKGEYNKKIAFPKTHTKCTKCGKWTTLAKDGLCPNCRKRKEISMDKKKERLQSREDKVSFIRENLDFIPEEFEERLTLYAKGTTLRELGMKFGDTAQYENNIITALYKKAQELDSYSHLSEEEKASVKRPRNWYQCKICGKRTSNETHICKACFKKEQAKKREERQKEKEAFKAEQERKRAERLAKAPYRKDAKRITKEKRAAQQKMRVEYIKKYIKEFTFLDEVKLKYYAEGYTPKEIAEKINEVMGRAIRSTAVTGSIMRLYYMAQRKETEES